MRKLLLLLSLAAFSLAAFAYAPSVIKFQAHAPNGALYGSTYYDSVGAACDEVAAHFPSDGLLTPTGSDLSYQCVTSTGKVDGSASGDWFCGDGSTPNTQHPWDEQCTAGPPATCPPRYSLPAGGTAPQDCVIVACPGVEIRLNNLSCAMPPLPCPDGQTDGGINYADGSRICTTPPRQCPDGTSLTADGRCAAPPEKENCPLGYHRPPGVDSCVKDTPGTDDPPNDPCPFGTRNISADPSNPNCFQDTPDNNTHSDTQTNPDGSTQTTQTTTTTQVNPDGTTTTNKTTTVTVHNADGSVSTTTSTATDTGNGSSDSQNPSDFCKLHPELNVCRDSTVSGTCGDITCTGDAIQCSILRETAKRNCDDKAAVDAAQASPEYALGNSVLAGADPATATLPSPANASTVTVPSSLDTSGWLGAGACFPDKTFTVGGHTITLSFTAACQPLLALRYVLMIVALLTSFRMLSGVIFRS